MNPKDAVHNRNIVKVFYENYKPISPFYKFDISGKVRIITGKRYLRKHIFQIGMKKYLIQINN